MKSSSGMLTRQGVRDLTGPQNGRRSCTHAWEPAVWIEDAVIDGELVPLTVRGRACHRCGTRKETDR